MSEYLLSQYRPVANALLEQHRLEVPESVRDNLANTILHAREGTPNEKGGTHSPMPSLRKADTHARALLNYVNRPPSRASSISNRCAKLSAALNDPRVAMELAIDVPSLDLKRLLEGLAVARADPAQLACLSEAVELIASNKKVSGRPWSTAKPIVRGGCIVWKRAGRTESFTWNAGNRTISGPLPAFLGDLLACCNGTHEFVRGLRRPTHRGRRRGDGLQLSDDAMRVLIAECKKAELF
jgi:hypothetical protein